MAVFGIDFGNLNSVISVARRGGVDVILNEVSKRETPSLVSFGEKERYIGEKGLDMAVRNWRNTVGSLKRIVGIQFDSPAAQHERKFMKLETRPADDGTIEIKVRYKFDERWFRPEQLIGAVFSKLRTYVEREQAEDLAAAKVSTVGTRNAAVPTAADCVVSAPAYYTNTQRKLLWQALQISGLQPLNIICETTAAALDYGIFRNANLPDKVEDAVVVAFIDFGHSATSASLVSFTKGQLNILGHVFDRQLGCRDFDLVLFEYFKAESEKKYRVNFDEDKKGSLKLLASCEKLKKVLSANPIANLSCELGEIDIQFGSVKREDCDELWAPLLDRLKTLLGKLKQLPQYEKLGTVEIIGGGSRMNCIKKMLGETFTVPIQTTLNASESIARGCAIMSAMLSPKFKVREFSVVDSNVFQVNLGYYSEKSTTVVEPAFPEINKKMSVLKPGDACPKTLNLTFDRSNDFDLYVLYENTEDIQQVTNQLLIGKWKVSKIPSHLDNPAVKVRLRLNPSMMVSIESASVSEEIEVEEEEEVEVPVEDESADTKTDDKMDTDKDGESKDGEKKEEDKKDTDKKETEKKDQKKDKPKTKKVKQLVKKKKTTKHECGLVALSHSGNSQDRIAQFTNDEKDMVASDKNIQETQEAKNNVESYIYDFRTKVSEGGELVKYIHPDTCTKFLSDLTTTEDWLYGDGDEAAKDDYVQKLTELQKVGTPCVNRRNEDLGLPDAVRAFNAKKRELRAKAENADESLSHIPQDELQKVIDKCDELGKLTDSEKETQDSAPMYNERTLKITTVKSRQKEMENYCNPILNKPKPKPKEKPKEEEKDKDKKEEEKDKKEIEEGEGSSQKEGEEKQDAEAKKEDTKTDGPGGQKMELD